MAKPNLLELPGLKIGASKFWSQEKKKNISLHKSETVRMLRPETDSLLMVLERLLTQQDLEKTGENVVVLFLLLRGEGDQQASRMKPGGQIREH